MEAQTKSVANRVSTILIVVVLCFASLVGCAAEGSDKSSGVPVQDNQAGSEVEQEGPSPAKYDSPVVFSFPDVFYLQSEDLQQSLSSYASFQVQGSDEVFITTDADIASQMNGASSISDWMGDLASLGYERDILVIKFRGKGMWSTVGDGYLTQEMLEPGNLYQLTDCQFTYLTRKDADLTAESLASLLDSICPFEKGYFCSSEKGSIQGGFKGSGCVGQYLDASRYDTDAGPRWLIVGQIVSINNSDNGQISSDAFELDYSSFDSSNYMDSFKR